MALLCLLLDLRAELGIVLSLAHVNHKLRGQESDDDERFVAKLAQQHELELHVCDAPVDPSGSGIEARARELRYAFFLRIAREQRVNRIATAHTLDDQAETVLLRMLRGTGVRGLSGIHPRILLEESGRQFGAVVRPLLGFRRAGLLEFLRERGQHWREDSSNRNLVFLRNRVRHRLLPILSEEFGESAITHLGELAEIARAEEEHWESGHAEIAALAGAAMARTPQAASLPVKPLRTLPLAAQRRLVRAWLKMNAADLKISFRLIDQALDLTEGPAGTKLQLSSGWNLRRARREILLEPKIDTSHSFARDYQYPLTVPGAVEVPELRARIEALVVDTASVPEDERAQLLNRELLPSQILIRNWRAGDLYWPAHTVAAKKVKELLGARHVAGVQKKFWPLAVADGCGIIWMRGFASPSSFCPPSGSAKAIWIREIAGMM